MRTSVEGLPSTALGSGGTGSSNNNNNNNNNTATTSSSGNSGSQYALCALGVGLVALGIVMIVWSVVPADAAGNNSSSLGEDSGTTGRKHKASSVAFVLVGSGVIMLLLSLCLGMRNKQREQQMLQEARNHGVAAREQEERETAEEQAHRYAVPSYEEVVSSGQYPVSQSNLRPSTSQLPSYDDLVQVDGLQYEFEGSEVTITGSQPAPAPSAAASTSNRRVVKNSRKLLPIKIRRIKSEKLHMKNIDNSQPAAGFSIEPLTPPPQYEDKVPPI
ncbi:transmembrane protein 51a [Cottoperca gobio]|uniref:Transmembrane protein 51-like n=1 Tax=Cottoperca gobio TaxID=56716 RepID=A0A6J2PZ94_COTGO|nr:transmembrane protein 51-like [Cottoperca gobio]XP_029291489.1 transmembrane protein 51-like [Cottoperca gobio]XP_029291490.1 transmembrane protein 51-like [Cottoperca gobio]XP_029291491.1 transmembrane protein 51-like [Cottoperca gobio]